MHSHQLADSGFDDSPELDPLVGEPFSHVPHHAPRHRHASHPEDLPVPVLEPHSVHNVPHVLAQSLFVHAADVVEPGPVLVDVGTDARRLRAYVGVVRD